MSFYKKKFLFVVILMAVIVFGAIILQRYPFGVKQYRTISLGMVAEEKAGDSTVWAPPDNVVPESSFFIYALGDESLCIGLNCGISGYFIECLGGWLSGYSYDVGDVGDYGLRDAGIDIDRQTIITIADKDGKIVGIYPGARIRNLPFIMRNYRNLVPEDTFKWCSDLLPSMWK